MAAYQTLGLAAVLVLIYVAIPPKMLSREKETPTDNTPARPTLDATAYVDLEIPSSSESFLEIVDDETLASQKQQSDLRLTAEDFDRPNTTVPNLINENLVNSEDSSDDLGNKSYRANKPVAEMLPAATMPMGRDKPMTTGIEGLSSISLSNESEIASSAHSDGVLKIGEAFGASDLDVDALSQAPKNPHDYPNWSPSLHEGKLPKKFGQWKISKIELASLKRFGALRVFSDNDLPTARQLGALEAKTRLPTVAESQLIRVLPAIATEKRLFIATSDRQTNAGVETEVSLVLSAATPTIAAPIFATESCLKCHDVEQGNLIGAFILQLEHKDPTATIKTLLNDLAATQ